VISFEILVTETVQLSRAVLLVNAECYTAWNTRLVGMQQYRTPLLHCYQGTVTHCLSNSTSQSNDNNNNDNDNDNNQIMTIL